MPRPSEPKPPKAKAQAGSAAESGAASTAAESGAASTAAESGAGRSADEGEGLALAIETGRFVQGDQLQASQQASQLAAQVPPAGPEARGTGVLMMLVVHALTSGQQCQPPLVGGLVVVGAALFAFVGFLYCFNKALKAFDGLGG